MGRSSKGEVEYGEGKEEEKGEEGATLYQARHGMVEMCLRSTWPGLLVAA